MDIDLLGYVVDRLQSLPRKEWPVIATESGVPPGTLHRIAHRYTTNPKFESVQRLAQALKRHEADNGHEAAA